VEKTLPCMVKLAAKKTLSQYITTFMITMQNATKLIIVGVLSCVNLKKMTTSVRGTDKVIMKK
jgi:hypothetical protein